MPALKVNKEGAVPWLTPRCRTLPFPASPTQCYNLDMDNPPASNRYRKLLVAAIFLLAALLRLYDFTDEPLELHPARQLRAVIIARGFYYETQRDIPSEQAEFAASLAERVGVIEPSIVEYLTALSYRLAGGETLWLGRLFRIAAWLLGGWALYDLAKRLGSPNGALLSLVYYLFLPYAVKFSRILLPDPIMVAGIVASLWALYRWQEDRRTRWAVAAGLLTGLTILIKSVAGIILIFPFAIFLLSALSLKQLLKNWQIWLILLLAALPTAGYYYWGLVLDGRLGTQFSGRFFPELWADMILYKSWGLRIILEFNLVFFIAALAGIILAKGKAARGLLFGWWLGYFVYGMIFAYFIWTHDYYHLPMAPLLAVSLSPAIAALEDVIQRRNWQKPALALFAVLLLGFSAYGAVRSIQFLSAKDYRPVRAEMEALGAQLSTTLSGKVIALTPDYETAFKVYTFLNAGHWPSRGDLNFKELQGQTPKQFEKLWQTTGEFAYFLVTDFSEFENQPLLQERLAQYLVVSEGDEYILFRLEEPDP